MSDLIFDLRDVSYAYPDGSTALGGVTFSVARGQSVAVLGANGCGKSTLFRLLSGLIAPQKGEFRAFGETMDARRLKDDRFALGYHRRVGYVFQETDAQLFCSTIRDEIAFGPLQLGLSADEVLGRVDDLSRMLGIGHLLEKSPFHLSGGEKKKAAIAAVLALNPEVLLLDEPANSLDPRTCRWLTELLLSLHAAGKTIVVSTHSLGLARELCPECILFGEDHAVAACGPTEALTGDTRLLQSVNLI